ncbi:MAG TPA: hypothetical protein VHE78_15010 [Gemmatimonadaceae bacterium]|nr:hypothetical protein [Gemmatimonadaceae bacterium]
MKAIFGDPLQLLAARRFADVSLELGPFSFEHPALLLEALLLARANDAEAPPPYDARGHHDETDERERESRAAAHATRP